MCRRRVQTCHRFISKDDFRFLCKGTGNTDALLFSAAQIIHPFHRFVEKPDPIETFKGGQRFCLWQREEAA
jgi:hypothetical protein